MNKYIHYTDEEKKYISENAGKKTPAEIAMYLNRPKNSIKVYMSKNGMLKPRGHFDFSKKDEKYILDNFSGKYLTEIASHLKQDYFKVYNFCIKRGLIISKRNYVTAAYSADSNTAFTRPAAKYSNTDYSKMYL